MSCSYYETNYGFGSDYCHAKKVIKQRDLGSKMLHEDWKISRDDVEYYKCNCSEPRYEKCPYYR